MEIGFYNSYLEVDLGVIRDNMKKVRDHVGPEHGMIPVVKGNAYGMGTVRIAQTLIEDCGIDTIACAQVYECEKIRRAGFGKDKVTLMLLGGAPFHLVPYIVKYDLVAPVFTCELARRLSAEAKAQGLAKLPIQIKIETGLNRIGVRPGQPLDELLDCVKALGNLEVVGAFTHFATATDYDSAFTREQYARFVTGVEQIKARGLDLPYIHCCNTGGTVWFKEGYCTHVRNGSLYLGYSSMDDYSNPLGVKEPASWRAFITNIHQVEPGESVGYDRHFQPDKPTMVATVAVGFADGLYRPMGMNGGPVLVNDTRTRYLGICMDQTFVDVTGIDCQVDDQVTIFGYSQGGALLPLEEIEQFNKQSLVYPLCTVGDRVARVYKE